MCIRDSTYLCSGGQIIIMPNGRVIVGCSQVILPGGGGPGCHKKRLYVRRSPGNPKTRRKKLYYLEWPSMYTRSSAIRKWYIKKHVVFVRYFVRAPTNTVVSQKLYSDAIVSFSINPPPVVRYSLSCLPSDKNVQRVPIAKKWLRNSKRKKKRERMTCQTDLTHQKPPKTTRPLHLIRQTLIFFNCVCHPTLSMCSMGFNFDHS